MGRFLTACETCRRRHLKCIDWENIDDRGKPAVKCANCARKGSSCVFQTRGKTGPKPTSIRKRKIVDCDTQHPNGHEKKRESAPVHDDILRYLGSVFGDADTIEIHFITGVVDTATDESFCDGVSFRDGMADSIFI